jgi:hypothetical protein
MWFGDENDGTCWACNKLWMNVLRDLEGRKE